MVVVGAIPAIVNGYVVNSKQSLVYVLLTNASESLAITSSNGVVVTFNSVTVESRVQFPFRAAFII